MVQADLVVSAEPGGRQEVYGDHGIAPSIAGLGRWGLARSRSLSYLGAAAASAAALDAPEKTVVEAADYQPQSLSTGSGLSSRLVIARDLKKTNVNVSFSHQLHQWKLLR